MGKLDIPTEGKSTEAMSHGDEATIPISDVHIQNVYASLSKKS